MQALSQQRNSIWTLPMAITLFIALFAISYPYYQYSIDPDTVCYLAIAKRYAVGDYTRAINGLWSPFQSWLVAFCLKKGMAPLLAAHLTNAISCIGIIICTFRLLRRFEVDRFIVAMLMLALPVFLLYCQYAQVFDDLWQVFFLLCYLLLILSPRFLSTWWKWIACAAIATLAYFAKAYSFYFIILHLFVSVRILSRREGKPLNVKLLATVYITLLIIIAPWVSLLHQKYGKWTISTAGALNASWTLTGHKTYKPGITYLIPPSYNNSPSNMEDPSVHEGHLYTITDSPKFILIQAVRSVYAFFQGIVVMNEISCFLFVLLAASIILMFTGKDNDLLTIEHRILLWAALIMPLGYLTIHLEARYIWLLAYIGMIIGATWLMKLRQYPGYEKAYYMLAITFALSYIAYPVYDMKSLFRKGEDTYKDAMQLKNIRLQGSFTSNGNPSTAAITALYTGMPYFTLDQYNVSPQALLADMRRYKVKYYLFYCKPLDSTAISLKDENDHLFPEVSGNRIPGLKVFQVNP